MSNDRNKNFFSKEVEEVYLQLYEPTTLDECVISDSESDEDDRCGSKGPQCKVSSCTSTKETKIRSRYLTNFYRLSGIDNPYICRKCSDKAVAFFKESCLEMRSDNENALSFKESELNSGVYEIIDVLDEPTIDNDPESSEMVINPNATDIIKEANNLLAEWEKDYDFESKFQYSNKELAEKIINVTVSANELKCKLDMDDIDTVNHIQELYASCEPLPKEVESVDLGVLDIMDEEEEDDECFEVLDDEEEEQDSALPTKPHNLPPRGQIERRKPQINQQVFVVTVAEYSAWVPAIVQRIFVSEDHNKQRIYTYQVVLQRGASLSYVKSITESQMAYFDPSPVRIAVGNRVISAFYSRTSEKYGKRYYSGVTAESPSSYNNYRYMIFFDNGNVQYSHHEDIRVTCESREDVCEYFNQSARSFIRNYFDSLPDRKLLNLNTMDVIKVEFKGKWADARVTAVDASLIEVLFLQANQKEWLYRGSYRIMYPKEYWPKPPGMSEQPSEEPTIATTRKPRACTLKDTDYSECGEPVRAVARKTLTRTSSVVDSTAPSKVYGKPQKDEFAGNVEKEVLMDALLPKVYSTHSCSPECIEWVPFSQIKIKGRNPLVIPLLCGFRRVDECRRGEVNSNVYYQAPCGHLLPDFKELIAYLQVTNCSLTVDLFNFDYWVKIFDEFKALPEHIIIPDLSYGREGGGPIPVVNSIDGSVPPYMEYMIKRRATQGVPLNTDPGFLISCDCEDDCVDLNTCTCRQKTVASYYDFAGPVNAGFVHPEAVGYQNKRLLELVPSGIYECNKTCKCSSSCMNRVVQQSMKIKVELFKTKRKGWGTRCLNDLPTGCFVCVYVGDILTEQAANEGGMQYGDEYFAELDYIEVMERSKPGYESDTEMDEDGVINALPKGGSNEGCADYSNKKPIYKSCVVPQCISNSDSNPSKLFFTLPSSKGEKSNQRRLMWLHHINRTPSEFDDEEAVYYVCQDHFNLVEDVDNYIKVKLGGCSTVVLKSDVVPHIFDCQKAVAIEKSQSVKSKGSELSQIEGKEKHISLRELYGKDETVYVMDAKTAGNIGRYLNHSCEPNIFVQNVFVDTHDLRFPWVAFFSSKYIKAGTELTWDYHYEVGSVPNKVLYCYCGTSNCKGRML